MSGILSTDPGFARGQTLGVTNPAQGTSVTGTTKVFTDTDPRHPNAGRHLSNRVVTCIAARNTSGAPALPGTIVSFKATAILDEVTAAVANTAPGKLYGVVDEYLASAGCANNDVCWIVVHGPGEIVSSDGTIAAGDPVMGGASGVGVDGAATPANVVAHAISAPSGGRVRALICTYH